MSRSQPAKAKIDATARQLAIEYLPLDAVVLDPTNAREHKAAHIRQIARSIEAFAFNTPVLIDKEGKVLAGHGRVLALRLLGRAELPVVRLEHLSAAQARAFAIADNRLTETSQWNERLLGEHLKALSELDLDFSLETTGFTMGEIDLKIEALDDSIVEDDPDDAPPDPGPPVAKLGDLWVLGPHRLLCASALEGESYERLMAGGLAAMVFCDPPYNVAIDGHVSGKGKRRHREFVMASGELTEPQFTAFLATACKLMAQASGQGALHYICIDWRHAFALMAAGRTAYDDLINLCVWTKPNGGMGGLYRSAHELVLVFKYGRGAHQNNVELGKFGRNRTNVWAYPGASGFGRGEDADLTSQHPTPKPVALIADALLDASARGDLILDPFVGSGSTLIACERVGRSCRAMEMDPLYVDLTIRRWKRLTGEEAIREEGGETFAELEAPSARRAT